MLADELRRTVLQSAISGQLTEQLPTDSSVDELIANIDKEKARLIKEKKIKKSKSLPPIVDDDKPFDIPKTWRWVRLDNISLYINAGGDKPKDFLKEKNPINHVQVIGNGEKNDGVVGYTKIAKYDGGCLTISGRGTIGYSSIRTEPFYPIVRLIIVKLGNKLSLEYVKYVCSILLEKGNGTGVQQLTRPMVKLKLIPLPPLEEQQRIVGKIEASFKMINEFEKTEIQLNLLKKQFPKDLKASLLQSAIKGELTEQLSSDSSVDELIANIAKEKARLIKEKKIKKSKPLAPISEDEIPFDIPKTWRWVRFGEIGDWSAGSTPLRSNSEYYGGNIPWLKTGDLNDSYINQVSEHITEAGYNNSSVRLNPIGSILIAMYGATIGKLGILNIEATTNQACCACIPYKGIYNKFLFYYLLAKRNEFIKLGMGSGQPNISKTKIVSELISLPPLEEQQRIVDKLDKALTICDCLIEK